MALDHTLVILFDVLVLVAVTLLLCTLFPAVFSKNVHRSVGWYNLVVAWLVYSLSYGLLVGRQVKSTKPPFGLCLFQTLLVYAGPGLVSASMVCYNIEFYLIISGLKYSNPRQPSFLRTFWLVTTPWLIFFAIILEVLLFVFPGKQLHLVNLVAIDFYCHLENPIPVQVTAVVCVCAAVILIPLEVWIGLVMYRNWDAFKNLSQTDRRLFLTIYLRLILCTLVAVIGLIFSVMVFILPNSYEMSLAYPAIPIFIAFAFGTQKDLLQVWLFWRLPESCSSIIFNRGTPMTTSVSTSRGTETRNVRGQQLKPSPVGESFGHLTLGIPVIPASGLSTLTTAKIGPNMVSGTPL